MKNHKHILDRILYIFTIIVIILIIFSTFGCSKEPIPCNCTLNTYRNVSITEFELISSEEIPCQEEDHWKDNDQVTFYEIICD